MHQIELIVGDSSGDGHEKTEMIIIKSSIDKTELEKAFADGVKKTGVDFENLVAAEYDENTISQELVDKLTPHGFDISEYSEDENPGDEGYSLDADGYVAIWLFIAKVGNPSFTYEDMTETSPRIYVGGYGLFE